MNEDEAVLASWLDEPLDSSESPKTSDEFMREGLHKPKKDNVVSINKGKKVEDHIEASKPQEKADSFKDVGKGQGVMQKKQGKNFFTRAKKAKAITGKTVNALDVPSIKDLPTPPSGGIGLFLFIALLMVFAISPLGKSGVTRLQLIWGTILGNYTYNSSGGSSSGGVAKTSASSSSASSGLPNYIHGGISV